jgi:hypothetical protein
MQGDYPGLTIVEPYPDWSLYENLIIEIYSENTRTFDLVLRVHDESHNNIYSDRYNKVLKIKTGKNGFHIPLRDIESAPADRKMDMGRISELVLFASKPAKALDFVLGEIRLE